MRSGQQRHHIIIGNDVILLLPDSPQWGNFHASFWKMQERKDDGRLHLTLCNLHSVEYLEHEKLYQNGRNPSLFNTSTEAEKYWPRSYVRVRQIFERRIR